LQFLWIQLPLSVTTRFMDESFVSYHLIWHIPLNKTHTVTSFFLECSNRRPPIAKHKQQDRKIQRLLRQSHYAVQISFLQSFQTSWVSTWLCLVVPVRTIRQMWIAWQSVTVPNMSISDVLQSEWRWRRGPRGEGDTHIRRTGVLLKNFDPLRSPKRYQDPVFFSSKRYQFLHNTLHYLPASYFFQLNTLKGIAKAPALDLLRLNTLRATKTSFLIPKRYDELPRPRGRGQGIQTAPCSPRVGRMFSLCLREKMETAVQPAQPPLHKGPPLCNGHLFHSGGRSVLF